MTLPHIEPMAPGAMPTADGYYVASYPDDDSKSFVVYVRDAAYPDDDAPQWRVEYIGDDDWYPLSEETEKNGLAFIARIYPDRIAARAQALSDLAAMDGETL